MRRMEVSMSLNALVHIPLSKSGKTQEDTFFFGAQLRAKPSTVAPLPSSNRKSQQPLLIVQAKGKRGMQSRKFQRPPAPAMPKIEDDGNPKFVIFIRQSSIYFWYPLTLVTGGTTAKIMVAAKDNFLGKYIYKDTLARNLASVIYRDEKEIQKTALKQFRVLRSATSFRYGYKLVENNNLKAALSPSDVIELPKQEELKTVLDKAKDYFGNAASGAKESFGKLTSLTSLTNEEIEEKPQAKS